MRDKYWMQQALLLAEKAFSAGEVPVGAVLINNADELIGKGWNQMVTSHDPTAHAELLAIREAARHVKNYRLAEATLYTTLEPCCMCAGAIINSRINRIVFATRDFKVGAAGSVYNLLQGYPLNHKTQIDEGPYQEISAKLLTDFFKLRRKY